MSSTEKQQNITAGEEARTSTSSPTNAAHESPEVKKPWWNSVFVAGSVTQIIIAAVLAVSIGVAVSYNVENIPKAATVLVGIPGRLWLRALRAVVLPLIVTAMILAVQRLKAMTGGGKKLAQWTIGYYVGTTLLAIVISTILTDLVWGRLMTVVSGSSLEVSEKDAETYKERESLAIHDVVQQMFDSFIPNNVVNALANDSLLAVLITAVVVGYLLDTTSSIVRVLEEIEVLITKIITFLIKLAPIGVFFLILPNLFLLDMKDIGVNLGILIGGGIANMGIHLFIVLPILFFAFTRQNPYAYWVKCSPAWLTAWGSASSAATLPVTMRCVAERGVPYTINKFSVPLGCLVNMDGTAIYFPLCVVFLAVTQGIKLTPADYVIICLLSTLASIGTTPIPSSSLVLTVMIASAVNVPITGMYGVIITIDWFLGRFRTAVNVSGDLFAARIVEKMTGIKDDPEDMSDEEVGQVENNVRENTQRV
ncbi:Sodium:dicarboxylate symporter [Cercophora newfieldiana]|uniref:Amino acid transporter n=1 Tax=Cercophora newfieldiana TaxID=92897 RepID=A0AA39YC44_9PEZI|nr:Sodium:dicarboxylate symporter [Cercophora newfieldiana]